MVKTFLFKWFRKQPRRAARDSKSNPIKLTGEGFACQGYFIDSEPVEVRWDSVQEISTWKDDLWSYDEIWVGFRYGDNLFAEFSEEQPGFKALVKEMRRRFPEITEDWFSKVMFPAFVRNYAVLLRRGEHCD